jgi:acetyltransferase-like isoleucine patch superfamily enzyme
MITAGEETYFAKTNNPIWQHHDPIVEIGKYSAIAGGVSFMGAGEHASVTHRKSVSNFPFFEQWGMDYSPSEMKGPILIGNDVWIGENAFIMDGITIGDGAIVGANAMVVRDVPPYAVVAGNPGEIKKYRFPGEVVEQLLQIKWWDWEKQVIMDRLNDFKDIDLFVKKYGTLNKP